MSSRFIDGASSPLCIGDARGEALLRRVESLAEAHGGHAQLADICEFAGDPARLHAHMAAGACTHSPAAHSFSVHV
jgi:hypothetical protein